MKKINKKYKIRLVLLFRTISRNRSERKWPSSQLLVVHSRSFSRREIQIMNQGSLRKNTRSLERTRRSLQYCLLIQRRCHHLRFQSQYTHLLIGIGMTRSERHQECSRSFRQVKTINNSTRKSRSNSTQRMVKCLKTKLSQSTETNWSKLGTLSKPSPKRIR